MELLLVVCHDQVMACTKAHPELLFKRSLYWMFVMWGFGGGAGRGYGSCPSSELTFVSLWVAALTLTVRPAEVPQLYPGG